MPLLISATTLLGLAIGSFLNVVVYRLPRQLSLSFPPSACPACAIRIHKRHNVPVLGWLVLRGRCAACSARVSIRYPMVELTTALLFIACTWQIARLHLLPALPAYLVFAAAALALGLIDLDMHRLSNDIVLLAYPVLGMGLTLAAVVLDDPAALLRAVICGMALYGFYLLLAFIHPRGLDSSNVELAGIIGGMLGFLSYQAWLVAAFGAFLMGTAFATVMVALRRPKSGIELPFGLFMLAGAFVALFAADPIWRLYSNFALSI